MSLADTVRNLGHPKILVVGDLVLDRYVFGTVSRISPEAPIPVFKAEEEEFRLGCAGSAARNLRVLGAEVFLAHPRLRPHLTRLIHLDAPSELCLRRVRARELPLGGTAEVDRTRDHFLPAQERFEAAYPPPETADLVLDATNPLGPA